MTFPDERPAENAYLAFIFDPPLEEKLAAINAVVGEAHRRGQEVRFWMVGDRLIVCAAVPNIGVDTGMGLYNALQAQNVAWEELEFAAPAEFYRALVILEGYKFMIFPAGKRAVYLIEVMLEWGTERGK
ncbi:MAG: hypothetical protein JXA42_23430 [Anaerolineales bacterium]|nr:hypothetical protein [Anaerolineales bacterium]